MIRVLRAFGIAILLAAAFYVTALVQMNEIAHEAERYCNANPTHLGCPVPVPVQPEGRPGLLR